MEFPSNWPYLLALPLKTLVFVGLVWAVRDVARAFFFPHLLLSKGTAGNRKPSTAILSKWFISLTRVEFYLRRDWLWILILSLCTVLIAFLPLGSPGIVGGENSTLIILGLFSIIAFAIDLTWWKNTAFTGTAEFLRITNKTLLSITVLILVFGYLGLIGMSDIQKALGTSAIALNPIAAIGFICVITIIQLITVDPPTRIEGWGVHHLTRNFLETFWYSFVVITFTGVLSKDPVLGFLEILAKTSILMVFCDAIRMFVPEPRGALIDRLTLYLLIPFALTMVLSLIIQGLR